MHQAQKKLCPTESLSLSVTVLLFYHLFQFLSGSCNSFTESLIDIIPGNTRLGSSDILLLNAGEVGDLVEAAGTGIGTPGLVDNFSIEDQREGRAMEGGRIDFCGMGQKVDKVTGVGIESQDIVSLHQGVLAVTEDGDDLAVVLCGVVSGLLQRSCWGITI